MTDEMPEIIHRKMAIAMGLKKYFTGRPCCRGHVAERFVADRYCCLCAKDRNSRHRAAHPYASKDKIPESQYAKNYYAANRDRLREEGRARYLARREQILQYQRFYRLANQEKYSKYQRDYSLKKTIALKTLKSLESQLPSQESP
jgi:hypothetical protein